MVEPPLLPRTERDGDRRDPADDPGPVVILAYDGLAADEASVLIEILSTAKLDVTIASVLAKPVTSYNGQVVVARQAAEINRCSALLVPGGFGKRGVEGKIRAARHARERGIPYLGICLGMQVAVIEFARHVAGIEGANSSEFDLQTPDPVIALITEWQNADGITEMRDEASDLGGTMRLGGQPFRIAEGSRAHAIYGGSTGTERHRHRWEFNDNYANRLIEAGLVVSARTEDGDGLVEIVELPDHPWFIGVQYHPEYTSTPRDGHPLFTSFVEAALAYQEDMKSRPPVQAGVVSEPAPAAESVVVPAATGSGTESGR